jgi:hypothetical protein
MCQICYALWHCIVCVFQTRCSSGASAVTWICPSTYVAPQALMSPPPMHALLDMPCMLKSDATAGLISIRSCLRQM